MLLYLLCKVFLFLLILLLFSFSFFLSQIDERITQQMKVWISLIRELKFDISHKEMIFLHLLYISFLNGRSTYNSLKLSPHCQFSPHQSCQCPPKLQKNVNCWYNFRYGVSCTFFDFFMLPKITAKQLKLRDPSGGSRSDA
jgi:hypothetical protein